MSTPSPYAISVVSDPDRAVTIRPPASRSSASARVECLVPRDGLQTVLAARERLEDAVVGAEVRVAEAALVAEPAAVDLRVVA